MGNFNRHSKGVTAIEFLVAFTITGTMVSLAVHQLNAYFDKRSVMLHVETHRALDRAFEDPQFRVEARDGLIGSINNKNGGNLLSGLIECKGKLGIVTCTDTNMPSEACIAVLTDLGHYAYTSATIGNLQPLPLPIDKTTAIKMCNAQNTQSIAFATKTVY